MCMFSVQMYCDDVWKYDDLLHEVYAEPDID